MIVDLQWKIHRLKNKKKAPVYLLIQKVSNTNFVCYLTLAAFAPVPNCDAYNPLSKKVC